MKIKFTSKVYQSFMQDHVKFINELIADHGPAITLTTMFKNLHIFADTNLTKHVLFDNYQNYVRPPNPIVDKILRDSAMKNRSDQDVWVNERISLINPMLTRQALKPHAETIIATVGNELKEWDKYLNDPKGIPIQTAAAKMALLNLTKMLFGDVPLEEATLSHKIQELFFLLAKYETSVTKWQFYLPTSVRGRTKNIVNYMHKLSMNIVNYCLSHEMTNNNLVVMLAKKYYPKYPHLSHAEKVHLAGRVSIFIIGGFESNSNNLIWVLNYLSHHPEITKKVYAELQEKVGTRQLTTEDVDNLTYMRAMIYETLRLATKAFIPRVAMDDDIIGDIKVKKGDRVLLPVFYMHHLSEYWPEPDQFQPERFLKPLDERYQFVYLAFSTGVRICLGREFAIQQIIIMLAMMMQKYSITLPPGVEINPNFQYLDPEITDEIRMLIKPSPIKEYQSTV